eukprot:TRINITY_DN28858_c0_g1_i1.p1 TRINITY_DN28858_c0_g1~~TRINITY_DN28858_c0_g1_i1.p1  ORF type:complete len:360 (+),score=84.68 TRINITY_DN28858_c0_g1_i1:50-1129(+)
MAASPLDGEKGVAEPLAEQAELPPPEERIAAVPSPLPSPGPLELAWLLEVPASALAAASFERDGFAVAEGVLPPPLCAALIERLDAMLAGTFDTGVSPDKVPSSVRTRKPRVEQFVNAWKGDALFDAVVHSSRLAAWVAELAHWPEGAEVLQDQIWSKPPGSGPIGFHRDTAYMGEGVVTAWLTLDDLEPNLGPLEYARGSHLWKPAAYDGYTPSLFGKKDYRVELDKAAAHNDAKPEIIQVLARRGGGSIHDGRTWHGSGVNRSKRPRRGLGIHFGRRGVCPQNKTTFARSIESGSRGAGTAARPEAEMPASAADAARASAVAPAARSGGYATDGAAAAAPVAEGRADPALDSCDKSS